MYDFTSRFGDETNQLLLSHLFPMFSELKRAHERFIWNKL